MSITLPLKAKPVSSSGSSAYTNSTINTEYDVTNLSVSFTSTGRPVLITLEGTEGLPTNFSEIRIEQDSGSSTSDIAGKIIIYRDSTKIVNYQLYQRYATDMNAHRLTTPTSAISFLEQPGAGTYTYKVANLFTNGSRMRFTNVILTVREI